MTTDLPVARLQAELVAKASDAIVIADREGRIVSWNAGAQALFGYPAPEAIGAKLDLIVPDRLRARHWAGYEATMRTGHSTYADRLLAVAAVGRDGNRLPIEFRVTLLGDEDGRPVAIGAVIRDVTERWAKTVGFATGWRSSRAARAGTARPSPEGPPVMEGADPVVTRPGRPRARGRPPTRGRTGRRNRPARFVTVPAGAARC